LTCLYCRLTLVNPDKNHRYCPYCGAIRAIGADNDLLFCGEETLSSYRVYAYSSPSAYPIELDPVRGPKDGAPWPAHDLLASSACPYPWSALRVLGPSPEGAGSETNLETPLKLARMRHRRLFLLTQNGQQLSLHSQSLRQVSVREVSPHQDMCIGESLLHLTSPNRDATNWTAYPLSRTQESVIEQRLPIYEGALTASFEAFAVLGAEQSGGQDVLWGRLAEPDRHHKARLALSSVGERGRPGLVRCGDDWLIVALDGKLYRQSASDPDPSEPENIFANPNRLKVLQVLSHGSQVVLLAQSTGSPRQTVLLTVGPDDGPALRKLAVGSQEGELRLTSLPEGLFLAIKPVGQAIQVYKLGSDSEELLMTLPGSLQHELDGLHPLPGDLSWGLMLATKRDQHWELWKIELPTGSYKQLRGQEPSHHHLSFPWEAGRGLYVNLTTGRIRELA
jgi:hypothetical protein